MSTATTMHRLLDAAYHGDLETLKECLAIPGFDVNDVTPLRGGDTALIRAAAGGHLECVSALLEDGALPNHVTGEGITAAVAAAMNCHDECMIEIVKAEKPDIIEDEDEESSDESEDENDRQMTTPLMSLVLAENWEGFCALLDELETWGRSKYMKIMDTRVGGEGITAMMQAACLGNNQIVSCLCDEGAEIDMQDDDGDTALIIASRENHWEVCATLIQKGADKSLRNYSGESALDVADRTDPSGNVILVLTGWREGPDQYDNIPEAQRLRLPGAPPRPQTGGVTFSRFYRRNNNQIV